MLGCSNCVCADGLRAFRPRCRERTDLSRLSRSSMPAGFRTHSATGSVTPCGGRMSPKDASVGRLNDSPSSAQAVPTALNMEPEGMVNMEQEISDLQTPAEHEPLHSSEEAQVASWPFKRVPSINWANGFRTAPEIEVIRIAESNISQFALPQEAIKFKPDRLTQICSFKNGDWERMIHCNTELDDEELEQLTQLRQLALQQRCAFSPSVSVAATRFISDARGDIPQALEKMKASQKWRMNFFKDGPITDAQVAEDLSQGVVYFGGRDKAMRPVIIARPGRIPKAFSNEQGAQKLTKVLIFCLEYFLRYMAIPGQIENICVLLDLKGVDAFSVPVSALRTVAAVLSQQHAGRVWRFYVCNMSLFFRGVSTVVQAFMTDRQIEKIRFISNLRELHKDFALHQLEKDLGGTRPLEEKFFPFPMPPGPFKEGDHNPARQNAVPLVHKLLSDRGAQGRLWEPHLSEEENTTLHYWDYSNSAVQILKQCGEKIPPCLLQDGQLATAPAAETTEERPDAAGAPSPRAVALEAGASVEQKEEPTKVQLPQQLIPVTSRDSTSTEASEEVKDLASRDLVVIEDVDICAPQVWSCMVCRCTVGITKRPKKI